MQRTKKLVFGVLTTCLSGAMAIAFAEIAIRIAMPGMNIPQREYDRHLGWRGRPNLRCILHEKNFVMEISQNSQGFRDMERDIFREAGVFRILCLGDSFTWGWAVPQEQIFTHQLESLLTQQGLACEVINAGVGGYSTDQELIFLEREGLAYAPELVVLQVTRNDLSGNTVSLSEGVYHKPFFTLEKNGTLSLHNTPVSPPRGKQWISYQLSRHSRLLYYLKHRLHVRHMWLASHHNPQKPSQGTGIGEVDQDYAFRLFCALVVRMHQKCLNHNAILLVVFDFPFSDTEHQYWTSNCLDVDTHFIHETLMGRQTTTGEYAWIPNDGHWSVYGHRWVAEYLFDQVLSMKQSHQSQQSGGTLRR